MSFAPYDGITVVSEENERVIRAIGQSKQGSLDEWLKIVRPLLVKMPTRLAVAASIAAPLIQLVGALPFVYLLWGSTGHGKTVAMMVAASVWGNPEVGGGYVQTMGSTKNATINLACFLHSLPYFGDEAKTIEAQPWFKGWDPFIYEITEGTERGRLDTDMKQRETGRHKTCFIFTGENPMTSSNSGGGTANRLIEAKCKNLFDIPEKDQQAVAKDVARAVRNCYGFLGPKYIAKVKELYARESDEQGKNMLVKMYDDTVADLRKTGTTDKQAAAMGLLMIADDILRVYFYQSSYTGLQPKDVAPFLKSKNEVSTDVRAYNYLVNHINENLDKFYYDDDEGNHHYPSNKSWGKIKNNVVQINANVCERELERKGFYLNHSMKDTWASRGWLITASGKRYVYSGSMNGEPFYCYKIVLPQANV